MKIDQPSDLLFVDEDDSRNWTLLALYPELAEEWHHSKNGNLKAESVFPIGNKKVWWKCKNNHEWRASIYNRVRKGTGCPFCWGHSVCEDNCLAVKNPKLAKEWNRIKNGKLKPEDFTSKSEKVVWWLCKKGHEWEASISNRSRGNGCPFCWGRYATKENNLAVLDPELAKEWHPTKNGNLKPKDVTSKSSKKVWWKCQKGHEWQVAVGNRVNSHGEEKRTGCPYCGNQKTYKGNCLATVNPELVKEWHPTKNGNLKAEDVLYSSDKKVWWKCKKGHEWETRISHRSKENGSGCPYCCNFKTCKDNCLATLNPKLAKEWHPTKNGSLTPNLVGLNYSLKKIWWKCKKGHEWLSSLSSRSKGNGCPFCTNRYICKDNCLDTLNHELAKQWHPTKNGSLTPKDVGAGSAKKYWWICSNGHEWEGSVVNRHKSMVKGSKGNGCPYCSNKIVYIDNCLAILNPKLAKEWHPIKNGDLTPYDVVPGSGKKVWWLCSNGHEWQTQIEKRSKGFDCRSCRRKPLIG